MLNLKTTDMIKGTLKILVFAPHSAIWLHAFPEALIVESLAQEGHEIIYITCGGEFAKYCICMSAFGLSQDASKIRKQKICDTCRNHKQIIKENFNFKGYDLDILLTVEHRKKIREIVNDVSQNNFLELIIDGIEIGRIALYELLLQYKKSSLNFSETEWLHYLIALENTLISFFACQEILAIEKPDRVITYNSLYSVNRMCCQIAEKQGISTYFLHAGGNLAHRLETMWLGKNSTFKFYQSLKYYWDSYKDTPCSSEALKLVTDHFIELFKGKHFLVYSSGIKDSINIREKFGIHEQQKILVATMSSYDERFAGETSGEIPDDYNLIFPTQIDWIKFLVKLMQTRQDLFLIIRVHPREFPNTRDSVKSEHAEKIEQIFLDLPTNVVINYPSDKISIYNLAGYTDLFLNAWSSVGEEMSLFGIPVLIYSPDLIFYPPDLNYVATSKEDFYLKIDQALEDGWSFERIRATYRWYALKFTLSVFDLSPSISWHQTPSKKEENILLRIINKIRRKILYSIPIINNQIIYDSQLKDCRKRARYLPDRVKINQLISEDKSMILDLLSLLDKSSHSHSLEAEPLLVKLEILRLFKISYYDQLSEQSQITPLYAKILKIP